LSRTKRKKSRIKLLHRAHAKKPEGYGKRVRTMKGFAIRAIMEALAARCRRNKKRVPSKRELRKRAYELFRKSKEYDEGGRRGLLG